MGLDSVAAMTGLKDLKPADYYSKIDGEVQKETSLRIIEDIQNLLCCADLTVFASFKLSDLNRLGA